MTDPVEYLTALRARHLAQPGRRDVTAIDVPTCAWLWDALAREHAAPRAGRNFRVCDLGSGFSTAAIRAWARPLEDVTCVTADHDRKWLGATARDLEAEGLSTRDLFTYDEWVARADTDEPYDVLFMDLNGPPLRVERFPEYSGRVRPGGLLVFDDWQFPHLREPLTKLLRAVGMEPEPVPETTDRHGRYAAWARTPE